jgi:hypothetical protein
MASQEITSAPRLNAAMRKEFLAHLSETANVSASARAIGTGTSSIYAERRRSADFRAAWSVALLEGYARLEADMLLDALTSASARTSDATLKARAQKDRLRLALLAMHRTSVKIAANTSLPNAHDAAAPTKAHFIAKLFKMRGVPDKGKLTLPAPSQARDHD